jgi:chromosome segregation ATPase
MPVPIIAAAAIGVGGLALGGGGAAVYVSSKDKKRMAELQDQIRQLQFKLQQSHAREKELLVSIEDLERQKLAFIKEIDFLSGQRETYVGRIADLECYVARNEKVFKKIIAALTFRLNKLKEENADFKKQIDELNKQSVENSQKSDDLKTAIIDIDTEKVGNMNNLVSLRSTLAEQEREIQELESQVM